MIEYIEQFISFPAEYQFIEYILASSLLVILLTLVLNLFNSIFSSIFR